MSRYAIPSSRSQGAPGRVRAMTFLLPLALVASGCVRLLVGRRCADHGEVARPSRGPRQVFLPAGTRAESTAACVLSDEA